MIHGFFPTFFLVFKIFQQAILKVDCIIYIFQWVQNGVENIRESLAILLKVRCESFSQHLVESPGLLSAIVVGTLKDHRHHLSNVTVMHEAMLIFFCITKQMPEIVDAKAYSQLVTGLIDDLLRRADPELRQRLLRGLATHVRQACIYITT